MTSTWILVGHEPVPEPDFQRWAEWFGTADRHVKLTEQGDVMISTVFLGLDHSFFGSGPPILFETMLFVAGDGIDQRRYATWDDAVKGHDAMVNVIFAARAPMKLP